MKKGLSELVFVLDMTGSMTDIADEAVKGLNNFIRQQKELPGEARFSLITFNSNAYNLVYDNTPLQEVKPMKRSEYKPDNMTPLLDTIGGTIKAIGERLERTPEGERPEKVIMGVMTDGEENFSRKFTRQEVFDMVHHQENVYKWAFIFLGANQDSYLEAGRMGFSADKTTNWDTSVAGTSMAYCYLNATMTSCRAGQGDSTVS